MKPSNMTLPIALSDRYAYHSSHGYYLNNNIWGSQPSAINNQITTIDGISKAGVSWHVDWAFPGSSSNSSSSSEDQTSDYEVKSYPYAGLELGEKQLVEDIASLWAKAEWDYAWYGEEGRANVAFDLFTSEDEDREISGGDYELMIWLAAYDEAHPIGDLQCKVIICGTPWNLYIGYNGETKVFSFVVPENTRRKSWEGDIQPFFAYLEKDHGFPADEQYLTAFQFGTETFMGAGRFGVWYWMGDVKYRD